jgi:hypothetical protein
MIAFAAALRFPDGLDSPAQGFPIHPRWDLASA